jgi:SP family arabinose:H+ symporter-like MFS transporter
MVGAIIFIQREFKLSPAQLGLSVSCATLGCMAGAILAGPLADRLGRKMTLAVTAFIFAVGPVGTVLAKTSSELDAFRIVTGLAAGISSVVCPMYMAEIAPVRLRGRLVTIRQLSLVIAGFIAVLVAYWLTPTANWRAMFASTLVPVIIFFVVLAVIPESPRWLIEKKQLDRARSVLARIYVNPEEVEREVKEIAASFVAQESSSFRELFRPGIRMALAVGVLLAVFDQLDGGTATSWYTPLIFQKAGFQNDMDVMLQTVIIGAWQLLCAVAAMLLVDRVGRRPLLFLGTLGMGTSWVLMGILFRYTHAPGLLILLTTMLAMGFLNLSLAPMFWLLLSEIYPTPMRAKGMAISASSKWICSFLAAQTFPVLVAFSEKKFNMISPVFWLFAAVCGGYFVFSYRMVPETKGRSLEEIGASWAIKAAKHPAPPRA